MKSPYTYYYSAPATTDKKQPAIFLLHGLGSNEKDLVQLVESFKTNCHIFSLQGPITHNPGYAFYTFPEEEGKPERAVFDKVLKYTEAFILEAIEEYNLDKEQIYIVGFNQGAVVAQTLAMVMGEAIRGTAVLSGFMPEFAALEYSKKSMENSKIFISHGTYDYVYPYKWAEQSVEFFNDYGTTVTFKSYEDGHGVTPENLQDLIAFLAEDLPINIH